eukprot:1144349-Pelagomonas_calceolata.AAC.5
MASWPPKESLCSFNDLLACVATVNSHAPLQLAACKSGRTLLDDAASLCYSHSPVRSPADSWRAPSQAALGLSKGFPPAGARNG